MVYLGPQIMNPREAEAISQMKNYAEAYRNIVAMSPAQRRRLRESAGVSVETMAEACGVTCYTIEEYELDCTPTEAEAVRYWFILQQLVASPEDKLTEEERRNTVALFENGEQCRHCGGLHSRSCPRVKSMTYHPGDGSLAKVEFWADDAWPKDNIIFRDSPQLTELEDSY